MREVYGKHPPISVCCDNMFVMPNADLIGATRGHLSNGIVVKTMEEQSLVSQVWDVAHLHRITI